VQPCEKEHELGNLSARTEMLEQRSIELHESQTRLFAKLDELIPTVAQLQIKASVFGAVGGLAGTLVTVGIAVAIWLARS